MFTYLYYSIKYFLQKAQKVGWRRDLSNVRHLLVKYLGLLTITQVTLCSDEYMDWKRPVFIGNDLSIHA